MVDYSTPGILASAKNVLLSPARFYQHMPKSGGYSGPALFVVAMTIIAALVSALLAIPSEGLFGALKFFVVKSVLWSVCSLLWMAGASIVFFGLWKLLGARGNFEVALRCTSYAFAMLPVLAVLKLSPGVGLPAGILYTAWLLVMASVHAQGVAQGKAIAAFGLLAVIAIWKSCGCTDAGADKTGEAETVSQGSGAATADAQNPVASDVAAHGAGGEANLGNRLAEPATIAVQERSGNAELQYAKPAAALAASAYSAKESADSSIDSTDSETENANVASSAENAGRALGELVRDVTDVARNVGEDIVESVETGIQKVGEQVAPDESSGDAQLPPAEGEATQQGPNAAAAGEAVGAVVRRITDAAREVGEGFKSALEPAPDSAEEGAHSAEEGAHSAEEGAHSAEEGAHSAEKSADRAEKSADSAGESTDQKAATARPEDPAKQAPGATQAGRDSEQKTPEQMTPEQLGAALGAFISRLNAAAEQAGDGFERGAGGAESSQQESAAADAGEVLGRFLRGFNEAVGAANTEDADSDGAAADREQ